MYERFETDSQKTVRNVDRGTTYNTLNLIRYDDGSTATYYNIVVNN